MIEFNDMNHKNNTFKLLFKALLKDKLKTFVILSTICVGITYIHWRWFFVMNWYSGTVSSVWGIILFIADLYGFFALVLFCFETLDNSDIYQQMELKQINKFYLPTVDVYICTYNESPELVRKTALAAKLMNYENKTIYILDDGHREEVKKIAKAIDVSYITRENNEHFKAGNINNALKQTSGELVVNFDADHVPTDVFLDKVIPFFQDSQVALLQTPQHFYNPDPFQRNLDLSKFLSNEQDLFFRVIQPGRNYWNAVICCGTNWIARRSSLEEIGYIPTDSITEDMLTSIKLQTRGYKTIYLNRFLTAGLSAETIREHLMQRYRWAKGNLEIFFSKDNPILSKDLNLGQRICYISSINYYFVGIARTIYLLAPSIFILFGLYGCVATLEQLFFYQVPYLIAMLLTFYFISKGVRRPFLTEIYESIIAYDLTNALMNTIFKFKIKERFRVTKKNIKFDREYFDLKSIFPIMCISVVVFASIIFLPFCYIYHLREMDALLINTFWLIYNGIICCVVFKVGFEKIQRRKYTRIPVHRTYEVLHNEKSYLVKSLDLSEGGALLESIKPILELERDQLIKFVCYDKFDSTEIDAKIVGNFFNEDSQIIRIEFFNIRNSQEEALIRQIYSYQLRWEK